MSDHPLINNPNDPLIRTGDAYQRALLEKLGAQCNGFSSDAVIGAAVNLLINAVRQTYSSRVTAEIRFNDLINQSKSTLLEHYDSVTGKRKGNFAHTQIVQAAHVHSDDNIN